MRSAHAALLAFLAVGAGCRRHPVNEDAPDAGGGADTGAPTATDASSSTGTGGATTPTTGTAGAGGAAGAAGWGSPDGGVARTLSFLPSADYPLGPTPGIAVGDLNGDGTPDVALGNSGTRNGVPPLNLLFNDGHGQLPMQGSFAPTLRSIAIADLDGDGRVDIMGTNNDADVLINKGDATFAAAIKLSTAAQLASTAVLADLNGDGRIDVATAGQSASDGAVSILVNAGSARFASAGAYPIGMGLYTMAAGDVDGDGDVDLVVAGAINNLNVLLNHGDATFAPAIVSPLSISPSLALGDLNGDGKADIAGTMSAGLVTLIGNGDGTFGAPTILDPGEFRGVAIGDLDGDGRPDVAAGSASTPDIVVFTNPGGGVPNASSRCGSPVQSLAIADMNADGKPDLVVGGGRDVSVLLNDGR
jgi:hypothetical protein